VYTTSFAYEGGVLAQDDDVYFIPSNATVGQKIEAEIVVRSNLANSVVFRSSGGIRSDVSAGQDAIVLKGRAGGTSSYSATLTPETLSSNTVVTIPDETFILGFRNVPPVEEKTTNYSLVVGDSGKSIKVGSGGSITIPATTFSEGDVITIVNNYSGNVNVDCSLITTSYQSGINTDISRAKIPPRGIITIMFIDSTTCILSGNIIEVE
jgi:hypothetical protein